MNNIKIITNYQYEDLYSYSKNLYKDLEFEKIGILGENNLYSFNFLNYIITDEKYQNIDIMIYIDEDCFVVNNKELLNLLKYFIDNKIDCIGMPDGGVVKTRNHNPVSINQFFCILNLKKIREKYNYDIIKDIVFTHDLKKYTPNHLIKNNNFIYDNFEPYYKIFFWMLKNNYKIEYLDAYEFENDKTTTILKNNLNIDFIYHTWYARKWKDNYHNDRIYNIIKHCNLIKK